MKDKFNNKPSLFITIGLPIIFIIVNILVIVALSIQELIVSLILDIIAIILYVVYRKG